MKLSNNFTLEELTKSQEAIRLGIQNEPNQDHIFNLPITVSSGYRSAELCERIGSSSKSQHTRGEAADFEVFGFSNKDVSDWIVKNLDYDQCILEFWTPDEPNSGWVHCSYSAAKNRRQYLKASKVDGKVIYSPLV